VGGINIKRWLLGSLAAAVVMFLIEGASSGLYQSDMMAAMQAHGLSAEMNPTMLGLSLGSSLLAGLGMVFFYAAARSRFGAGPRTAAIVGFFMWLSSYLLSVLSIAFFGIFPTGMLITWALVGLVETQAAAWVGARIYQEG